jgi:hypothetical protein
MSLANYLSVLMNKINSLNLLFGLGFALTAAFPVVAAPPPSGSTVTVYNCTSNSQIYIKSYNSNDKIQSVAYSTSATIKGIPATANGGLSPSSITVNCATSDGCILEAPAPSTSFRLLGANSGGAISGSIGLYHPNVIGTPTGESPDMLQFELLNGNQCTCRTPTYPNSCN